MRPYPVILLACLAAACSNPTAPSTADNSQPGAAISAIAGGSDPGQVPAQTSVGGISITGPRASAPDCLRAATVAGILEWRIANVPAGARIDRGYGHLDNAACGRTEDDLRTENDHLRFERDPASPTTLIVRFDKDTYSCGHAQIDISIDGTNVLGEVLDYGTDCGATVTTTPPAADCLMSLGERSVTGGVATFEVLPGASLELSLVSYKVDPRTKWFLDYTQIFWAGSGHGQTFGPGVHTLSVSVPAVFQTDLLCGGYREENLTTGNINDYGPRTVADDSNYWR